MFRTLKAHSCRSDGVNTASITSKMFRRSKSDFEMCKNNIRSRSSTFGGMADGVLLAFLKTTHDGCAIHHKTFNRMYVLNQSPQTTSYFSCFSPTRYKLFDSRETQSVRADEKTNKAYTKIRPKDDGQTFKYVSMAPASFENRLNSWAGTIA